MSKRPMTLKRWRELRADILSGFEDALANIKELDDCQYCDKDRAAELARDVVLASLFNANAIEPPRGIDPS
jgi:hypothetical protein